MYDFDLTLGDTLYSYGSRASIDSVSYVIAGERLLKRYHLTRMYDIYPNYIHKVSHVIIEGLGSDLFFFMYRHIGESPCLCEDFWDTKLISYENDTIRIDSIDFESNFLKVDIINGIEREFYDNVALVSTTGKNSATIKGLEDGEYLIDVISVDGKLLRKDSKNVSSSSLEVPFDNLNSGFYLIKLKSPAGYEKVFKYYTE